jgi:hypothetical protein
MHYRFQPYPYYRRYYNINPYHSSINQRLVNFGGMTNVTQDANIYQLRTPAPEPESVDVSIEPTEPTEPTAPIEPTVEV